MTTYQPAGRDSDRFIIRMPDGMRDYVRQQAAAGYRSMNSQILMMLDTAIAAQKAASAPMAVESRN